MEPVEPIAPRFERSVPGSRDSSAVLLERAREGDGEALERLYRRYLAPLRAWARRRLPRWAREAMDTDDVVQETLLRSLRHVEVFEVRRTGAFYAYLRRGVINRIRDEIRRLGRQPRGEASVSRAAAVAPSPVEEVLGREASERYERCLQRLRARDREAVLARLEVGLGYREIAAMLGRPSEDAARMAVKRALRRLAEEMSRA